MDANNSMVITRGKGGGEEEIEDKGGQNMEAERN